jgi:hypothetical protein
MHTLRTRAFALIQTECVESQGEWLRQEAKVHADACKDVVAKKSELTCGVEDLGHHDGLEELMHLELQLAALLLHATPADTPHASQHPCNASQHPCNASQHPCNARFSHSGTIREGYRQIILTYTENSTMNMFVRRHVCVRRI